MNRETKIGILLVLVLAGVFGFLVYKKATRPGDVVAKAGETSTDGESTDGETAPGAGDEGSNGFDETESEQPLITASSSTRPIPSDDALESEDNLDDPFNTAPAPETRTAAKSKPRLPTMIPDDDAEEESDPQISAQTLARNDGPDLDEDDPFNGAEETMETSEPDPFAGSEESQTRSTEPTIAAPEDEEEFAAPIALDSPTVAANPSGEPSSDAPALGFEEADEDAAGEFLADEAEIDSRPPIKASPPAEGGELLADEEDSVSIKARTKLPETAANFGEAEEPLPLETESESELKELPTESSAPELMLDDADEDRYGGYEPIELTAATAGTSSFGDDDDAGTVEDSAEADPFAAPGENRVASTVISGDRYVIKPGDNFWTISQKKYGAGRYFQALAAWNQSRVPDAARMKPGVEIALPPTEELESRFASLIPGQRTEEPAAASGASNAAGEFLRGSDGQPLYRVGSGDTLSGIAQKYLGRSRRWEQILEMNRETLKDGNTLKLGAVLRLPSDATESQLANQPSLFR